MRKITILLLLSAACLFCAACSMVQQKQNSTQPTEAPGELATEAPGKPAAEPATEPPSATEAEEEPTRSTAITLPWIKA